MRATFSISFYCRESKVNRQGLSPLELSININQERLFINLPSKLNPKEFNKKRKPAYMENLLNTYRVRINEVCTELMAEGLPITASTLREYLKTGGTKSKTIEALFEEYLSILKKRVGKTITQSVYSKYELVKNFVCATLSPNREVCTITNKDIVLLYDTLKERYLLSTAGGYMTKIKTIFRYALDNNIMKINPFNGIKIDKGTPTIEYLTGADIEAIKGLKLEDYPRLERVRDLALIQMATGLSYVDLMAFNPDNITHINGIPTYTSHRKKTNIEFTTTILPFGMDVIDKGIPIISNQKYNQYLKEIQQLAKIKTNLTTHLLRKTFATLLLNSGVSLSVVAKTLGHATISTTQKHYIKTTDDFVAQEISKIFNNPS